MKAITLPAHFDGQYIRLDQPCALEPDSKLLVTVLPKQPAADERESWWDAAAHGLTPAYGPAEPEYSQDLLKERNPDYAL